MRTAPVCSHRSRVDDRASFREVLERCFCHVEEREHVGAEGPLELVGTDIFDVFLGMLFRGVVNQNIEAPEFLDGLLDSLFTKSLVADISCDGHAATAMTGDQSFSLFGVLMLIQINHRYVRSFLSESDSDRTTNSAISARDECDLVFEFPRREPFAVLQPRSGPHLRFETRLAVLMQLGTR